MNKPTHKNNTAKRTRSPYLIILGGFFLFIIIGAFLLMLPFSQKNGRLNFVNVFFTAVSAVCVTGLSVTDLSSSFNVFGLIVIAILIQLGGLGFITTAMFIFTLIGAKITWGERILIKETLNQNAARGLVILVKKVVYLTLILELSGTVLNFLALIRQFPFIKALGYSVFHAIASFNNAGFVAWPEGTVDMVNNVVLNVSTSVLIIFGGLGFIVISELISVKSIKRLSLHTKAVLTASLFLLVLGTLLIKLSERGNIGWFEALFMSISSRTAGFSCINTLLFSPAAMIVTMWLMLIGASPASTGGGIKTTTLVVIWASVRGFFSSKPPSLFYRRFGRETVFKAYILTVFSIIFIMFCAFLLMLSEHAILASGSTDAFKLFFEAVSAFSTCGISLGVTPQLSAIGRLIVCLLMFIGRLGPLTLIGVLSGHMNRPENNSITYPEAKIIIG